MDTVFSTPRRTVVSWGIACQMTIRSCSCTTSAGPWDGSAKLLPKHPIPLQLNMSMDECFLVPWSERWHSHSRFGWPCPVEVLNVATCQSPRWLLPFVLASSCYFMFFAVRIYYLFVVRTRNYYVQPCWTPFFGSHWAQPAPVPNATGQVAFADQWWLVLASDDSH